MPIQFHPSILFFLPVLMAIPCSAQQQVEMDRVVAVVDRQVILASDLEQEERLEVLEPPRTDGGITETSPQRALDRLISRALIMEQVEEQRNAQKKLQQASQDKDSSAGSSSVDVSDAELNERIAELRRTLPDCENLACTSDKEWSKYLAAHQLTPDVVAEYQRHRMMILRFIEQRFRAGIQVAPDEIEKYYREKLVPLYKRSQDAPPLDKVSSRVGEILLQQQVNALFSEWLQSLREEGNVEILDASLMPAEKGGAR